MLSAILLNFALKRLVC